MKGMRAKIAFDSTDYIAEYGLKVASPAALAVARKFVDTLVQQGMAAVEQHFAGMKELGQNPYRDKVSFEAKDVRFVAPVNLFTEAEPQRMAA